MSHDCATVNQYHNAILQFNGVLSLFTTAAVVGGIAGGIVVLYIGLAVVGVTISRVLALWDKLRGPRGGWCMCMFCIYMYRSVPQIRTPFCNLSLSTKRRGGAYTRDATISPAITPSLPIKHDSIVICRWGVEAKREASPNARRRDAPDASGRLTSFSVEGRESRMLQRSS